MTSTDPFAGISASIASALVARGFTELTSVQRAVLDAEFAGRDLRISSQTGSGKTVAIGLALARELLASDSGPGDRAQSSSNAPRNGPRGRAAEPVALIIVPTRELAAQLRSELQWLFANMNRFSVEVVTGGTSIGMERHALARRPALVVGTPGRLLDHMRSGALACDQISHVVLDEADQMLDMGFREELEAILEQLPEKRSSHLVSATFPRAVLDLANRFQRDVVAVEGTRLGVANADIHHIAYAIRRHETYAALVNVLLLAEDSRCLLFVNRRVDAAELAEKLASDGFGAAPFSGELPQAQRTRTLNAFKNGTFKILVSTDVAARGIDVPEISTVIHVDPPRTSDAYIHRSGRTGRAGRTGKSILLVAGPELRRVTRMLRSARVEVSWQPIPKPEKVHKALMKQGRRQLHERLSSDPALTEAQLVYARQLLEDKDPARLVATLLEMATPVPPHEPMKVEGIDPFDERPTRPGAASGHSHRSERRAHSRAGESEGYTSFRVSWGERTGATASRLLSHVCRRGGIRSHQVGAIRIDAKSSTIDVATDVAADFEAKARRPDKRDPGIQISRSGVGGESRRDDPGSKSPYRASKRAKSGASEATASAPPCGPSAARNGAGSSRGGQSDRKSKGPRRKASR